MNKLFKFFITLTAVIFEINAMSTFLEVKNCTESTTKRNAIFSTISGGNIDIPYRLIADSSYDQTFKKIFDWDNIVDGISGQERSKSLLNSIFYPDAGESEFKIRVIESLPKESTRFDKKTPLGALKFDIACRCSCWSDGHPHEVKIFDVEMQTCYEAGFVGRLFDYGSTLRTVNDHKPVVILAFLNYVRGEKDESCATGLFYKDELGNPTIAVKGVVDTQCLYLPTKAKKLLAQEPITIEGKKLGNTGREWLKLLSLRHWATKVSYGSVVRYVVPKLAEGSDPAIKSALTILESVNDLELNSYIQQESSAMAMLRGAMEDGIQQGIQQGALQQAKQTAIALINMGMENANISIATGLSIDDIDLIRRSLQSKGSLK